MRIPDDGALNAALIGIAGVHFVAAELAVNGIVAAVTSRNSEGIDIIACKPDGSKSVSLQVKTSKKCQMQWMLNKNSERLHSRNFFYVFVELKTGREKPECFVVPSPIVARFVRDAHRKWLRTPGRNGRRHRDGPIRQFWFHDDQEAARYLNRWDRLPQ